MLFTEGLLCPGPLKRLISRNPHDNPMKSVQSVPITLSCFICNLGTGFLFKFSCSISGAEIRCQVYLTSEHIPGHWKPLQCFCVKQSKAPLWEDTVLQGHWRHVTSAQAAGRARHKALRLHTQEQPRDRQTANSHQDLCSPLSGPQC